MNPRQQEGERGGCTIKRKSGGMVSEGGGGGGAEEFLGTIRTNGCGWTDSSVRRCRWIEQ